MPPPSAMAPNASATSGAIRLKLKLIEEDHPNLVNADLAPPGHGVLCKSRMWCTGRSIAV